MDPLLATLICACGIAGLFYLDRDKTVRTSRALWLPVVYFWLIGSRPLSFWLGITPPSGTNVQTDGSPFDAAIFVVLLSASIVVLSRRRRKTFALLAANWPILIFFVYCLISVAWSYDPAISLKRWIKATIDLVMALIVVTDGQPVAALKRLISRVGFVLLPASLLLIKYYGNLGRSYTPNGEMVNTGVTTNKNVFGVLLLVISMGTLWHLLTLVRAKGNLDRRRLLFAQGVLLAFCGVLLRMAHSATSIACFILGGGLILATSLRVIRDKPARVQALCLSLALIGSITFLFAGQADVANALGRDSNLSGRTDIWAALIPTVPNSIVGAGFEGYWMSPNAEKLWSTLALAGWWHPEILVTEAHNGYIEVYMNLGWVGVGLIALILVSGYKFAMSAFRVNPSVGSLMLAYIIVSAAYSITEAGFRSPNPMWIFLLLSIVGSTAVTAGFVGEGVANGHAASTISSRRASVRPKWAYRNGSIG